MYLRMCTQMLVDQVVFACVNRTMGKARSSRGEEDAKGRGMKARKKGREKEREKKDFPFD